MLALQGQEHLLAHWAALDADQQAALQASISRADVPRACAAFKSVATSKRITRQRLAPIPSSQHVRYDDDEADKWWSTGLEAIARGRVATCLLAGGQGTRLGSPLPKATIALDVARPQKSLLSAYLAQMDKLVQLARDAYPECSPSIRVLIMTSDATRQATEEHLATIMPQMRSLDPSWVQFFDQAMLPSFDETGKIYMAEKAKLTSSPCGNGGVFSAVSPYIDELKANGVEMIHVFCIDNILARPADPAFIGYAIENKRDCVAKVIAKTVPDEPVGVVCLVDGKPQVVEYTELPHDVATLRSADGDGKLVFSSGNIASHVFSMEFMQRACDPMNALPWHAAYKKIAHVDGSGVMQKPATANGIKLETFIFDAFPLSESFAVYECKREDEFAPLKNADSSGVDCPTSCVQSLRRLHASWVTKAGGSIVHTTDKSPVVEIDVYASYSGEGLRSLCDGKKFDKDCVIGL